MSIKYLELSFIEDIADELRTSSKIDGTKYVDVEKIAQVLGFKVYETDFDNDSISGKVINTHEVKEIYVADEAFERQRFTIAHELGHIILHHKPNQEVKEIDYRTSSSTFNRKEFQADAFAAALLMPKEIVKKVWNSLNDVDDLATYFKVSKAAASIRLLNLKLI